METIQTLHQFNDIIASSEPVIIKFFAGWCPDCTRMDMFIDEVIADYGQYRWFQISRDDFPELGQQYDVLGIPSLLLFQGGEKRAHLHSANAKSPEQVREYLEALPV